jgi:hypothetical protein
MDQDQIGWMILPEWQNKGIASQSLGCNHWRIDLSDVGWRHSANGCSPPPDATFQRVPSGSVK